MRQGVSRYGLRWKPNSLRMAAMTGVYFLYPGGIKESSRRLSEATPPVDGMKNFRPWRGRRATYMRPLQGRNLVVNPFRWCRCAQPPATLSDPSRVKHPTRRVRLQALKDRHLVYVFKQTLAASATGRRHIAIKGHAPFSNFESLTGSCMIGADLRITTSSRETPKGNHGISGAGLTSGDSVSGDKAVIPE